jgi:hypothetical protein
MDCLDRTNVV